MINFLLGFLLAAIVAVLSWPKGRGSGIISYDYRLYNKDWDGLKDFLERKLWNLHREEVGFQKNLVVEIKKFNSLKRRKKLTPELKAYYKKLEIESEGWKQQIGKMIFISGLLRDVFNAREMRDKVWKERGWFLSADGNRVITKPKEYDTSRKNKDGQKNVDSDGNKRSLSGISKHRLA